MLRRSLIVGFALAAVFALASSAATPKPVFPVTVHTANGDVAIKQRPVRIVSLSPSATEGRESLAGRLAPRQISTEKGSQPHPCENLR